MGATAVSEITPDAIAAAYEEMQKRASRHAAEVAHEAADEAAAEAFRDAYASFPPNGRIYDETSGRQEVLSGHRAAMAVAKEAADVSYKEVYERTYDQEEERAFFQDLEQDQ
jgi:hypothetical protein